MHTASITKSCTTTRYALKKSPMSARVAADRRATGASQTRSTRLVA